MKRAVLIAIVLVLIFSVGCSNQLISSYDDVKKPIVYTSFYPLYYLTDQIGKDKIDLNIVIPNGVEPHSYEPSIKQIKDIQKADIFIYNGANMEPWCDKLVESIEKDELALINGSENVEVIKKDNVLDPHIWLNPLNMDKIGQKIKNILISKDNDNKEFYEKNYLDISNKLKDLDIEYKNVLKNKKTNTILVSHSAFSYMAKQYGLKQISVAGITPNEEPTPKTIANLIDIAKDKNIKYMFLEKLANPKTANIIAEEANLKVLTLDPIAGLTENEKQNDENYISIMKKNLQNLKKALVN